MSALVQALYAELLPVLLQLIAAALGLILLRAAEAARKRWGIEIEARHREALQSAIMSGVSAALSRGLSGPAAVQAALDYARHSVPDALVALAPADDVLSALAAAKILQVQPVMAMKPGTRDEVAVR